MAVFFSPFLRHFSPHIKLGLRKGGPSFRPSGIQEGGKRKVDCKSGLTNSVAHLLRFTCLVKERGKKHGNTNASVAMDANVIRHPGGCHFSDYHLGPPISAAFFVFFFLFYFHFFTSFPALFGSPTRGALRKYVNLPTVQMETVPFTLCTVHYASRVNLPDGLLPTWKPHIRGAVNLLFTKRTSGENGQHFFVYPRT